MKRENKIVVTELKWSKSNCFFIFFSIITYFRAGMSERTRKIATQKWIETKKMLFIPMLSLSMHGVFQMERWVTLMVERIAETARYLKLNENNNRKRPQHIVRDGALCTSSEAQWKWKYKRRLHSMNENGACSVRRAAIRTNMCIMCACGILRSRKCMLTAGARVK